MAGLAIPSPSSPLIRHSETEPPHEESAKKGRVSRKYSDLATVQWLHFRAWRSVQLLSAPIQARHCHLPFGLCVYINSGISSCAQRRPKPTKDVAYSYESTSCRIVLKTWVQQAAYVKSRRRVASFIWSP